MMGTGSQSKESRVQNVQDLETEDDQDTKLDFKLLEELKEQTYDIKDGTGTLIKINLKRAQSDESRSESGRNGG